MPSFLEERGFDPVQSNHHIETVSDSIADKTKAFFRDYVKTPRPSGYRSLHITVHDDMSRCYTEVQLRTKDMDDMAEIGGADHYVYEKVQEKNRTRKDLIKKGECKYFDEAYERLCLLQSLDRLRFFLYR